MTKDTNSTIQNEINKIILPIFNKSPKEMFSNSMTIESTTQRQHVKRLWRPNNYRRELPVKKKDNSTLKLILTTIDSTHKGRWSYSQHTKLFTINYKLNIILQYGKDTLTAIYSQNIIDGQKETFLIKAKQLSDIDERIDQKKDEITKLMDSALNDFVKRFKIRIQGKKAKWKRYEDWVKGDEYISKLKPQTIIHDTYFKKVYDEGIEFKSSEEQKDPVVNMKQYIKNSIINDFQPLIAEEINILNMKFEKLIDINLKTTENVKYLAENINTHIPVLNKLGYETGRIGNAVTLLNKSVERLNQEPINFNELDPLALIKSKIKKKEDLLKMGNKIALLNESDKDQLTIWFHNKFSFGI